MNEFKFFSGTREQLLCCICAEPILDGFGNNPSPVIEPADGDIQPCCDACNNEYIIPARMGLPVNFD